MLIKDLLNVNHAIDEITIRGWVRTRRDSKEIVFLEINDGSCLRNVQVVVNAGTADLQSLAPVSTGAAVSVSGSLVASPGKDQAWELRAQRVDLVGACPVEYPLQKKRHGDEFLRAMAHLRLRTNKYGAVARIRSRLAFAVHDFLQTRDFVYVHTPIITGSDCEGAGEMFQITTLNLTSIPKTSGAVDFHDDFFGRPAYLTVSGQLPLETYCLGMGRVYAFGPTFRSENSNTSRHMAEFWMLEPEIAFANLEDDINLAEELIRALVRFALTDCEDDIALFNRFVDPTLVTRLTTIADEPFVRLSYTDAVNCLLQSGQTFEFTPAWGADLQSEHERYLTEIAFRKPVVVYDWPLDLKPFYMRQNPDNRTVAAMDILVPGVGELIGGSQREERLDRLQHSMNIKGLRPEPYWWYLDTRRFGSAPHAGFGLGFERLLMLVTGISNIRDVIPFPRTPNNLEF